MARNVCVFAPKYTHISDAVHIQSTASPPNLEEGTHTGANGALLACAVCTLHNHSYVCTQERGSKLL